jgi:hypothetical protein
MFSSGIYGLKFDFKTLAFLLVVAGFWYTVGFCWEILEYCLCPFDIFKVRVSWQDCKGASYFFVLLHKLEKLDLKTLK